MNSVPPIAFDNRYLHVANGLARPQKPTPVRQPSLIRLNNALAQQLNINLGWLRSDEGLAVLAGNAIPAGAEPVATVYAGHQFGSWNPQLGDGRAILLGEVIDQSGQRFDVQLKGAGETPFSRMGDGRSALGPVLREYIVSEAMAALGVPTTRALAAVATGESVFRDEQLPGAILTRIAASHIRVGTFQFFASRQDIDTLRQLANHVIERHYPKAATADNPYLALLAAVIERQSRLIAHWQSIGFIHGVMNTDNMLISGDTVDYGPCAFMENYRADTVFSSIDHNGRYAYKNQPPIGLWNLVRLAETLLPLMEGDRDIAVRQLQDTLATFETGYLSAYRQRMANKLGFAQASDTSEQQLDAFLSLLGEHGIDFTLGFRVLADYLTGDAPGAGTVAVLYPLPDAMLPWLRQWRALFTGATDTVQQLLLASNPVFIPRNHQIEEAIQAGAVGDFKPFHQLVDILVTPFDFDPARAGYALPATPEQRVTRTFCGT